MWENNGFSRYFFRMKIAISQINFRIGDFAWNRSKIIDAIVAAKHQGADLVVFSELSVCGYPPADLLNRGGFADRCLDSINQIAIHCVGIAAIVGAPFPNTNGVGKGLFNAAFLLTDGEIGQVVRKGLLPTYDVFDEYRYFEPAREFEPVRYKDKTIALTICEDIWNIDAVRMYHVNPMDDLVRTQPDMMINISASPFSWNRGPERMRILSKNAVTYKLPLFYVNQLGANTDLIFDGGSAVINSHGELLEQLPLFEESLVVLDTEHIARRTGSPIPLQVDLPQKNDLLCKALIMGISDYFRKMGLKKAIVGLSGGIDSALTLVLAVEALGAENLLAILLPGPYSSDHSVSDAIDLARKLNVSYEVISISEIYDLLIKTLNPYFSTRPFGIAEENLQARARAVILMALSNKYGHVLLNTSNKSEAAVGYGTLYGDMCGGLSVIGDLYKTEVYELARYINRNDEVIPFRTIEKAPSAELRPNQRDTDSLPDYNILDPILFKYIEEALPANEIINSGFDEDVVNRVIRLVDQSEYKRKQSPPVLRVSQKAFGTGRRMPIVAAY